MLRVNPDVDLKWFDKNDYTSARSFGFKEWYAALVPRDAALRKERSENYRNSLPAESRWEKFESIRIPNKENLRRYLPDSDNIARVLAGGTLTELETSNSGEEAISYADNGWKVLAINPWAPHHELRMQFKSWLGNLPNQYQQNIVRAGPSADNIEIVDKHLADWKNYHVLECLDIDLWASIFSKELVTHTKLCDLVADAANIHSRTKWGRTARDKCRTALSALPLLTHILKNQN